MGGTTRTVVRVGVAVATVTGLVAAGAVGASATPRKPALPYERGYLDVTINAKHLTAHYGGSYGTAGAMDLSLSAVGGEREVAIVKFAPGYAFKDLRDDIRTFGSSFGQNGPSKKGLKALNHAINHATGYGGIDAPQGKVRRGTVLLDQQGTYVVFDDSHNLPRHPLKINVSGQAGPQHLPSTGALAKAKTNRRFAGDAVLPAKGDITFKNISTESPHFFELQHVKEGTTRKEVIDYLNSNAHGAPPFAKSGGAGTDLVSYGHSQTIHVNLPAGEYVEMCFFPDPKTGMPHALMGMVRVVHLK